MEHVDKRKDCLRQVQSAQACLAAVPPFLTTPTAALHFCRAGQSYILRRFEDLM